jgi:signal transduction histidine kinase
MLFGAIYWQTRSFELRRIAAFVVSEADAVSQGSPEEIKWTVQTRFVQENQDKYHNMMFSALFAADGHLISGNIDHIPADLPHDSQAHNIVLVKQENHLTRQRVIAVARPLPNGEVLVFARGVRVLNALEDIVAGALLLGAIPAIGPALAAGLWLSRQAQLRVKAFNQSIERIMQGNVHERLPVQGGEDDFDQLADSVNRMLAEIERLLAEVQGVSDNIAHDLRTPLARVRTLLERGRDKARTAADLAKITDRAIAGLDQAQAIITALLRIGEIEGGQRRAAFCRVDLNEIAAAASDLYGPIAEEKQLQFVLQADATSQVDGDRDLLIEAVANLLDNAIKFAPPGGTVQLMVTDQARGPVIRVTDSGPGIPPDERAAVMKRFYRIDKSRHIQGNGLGLSIVLAIVKLHDFDIVVRDAYPTDARPGCMFEVGCYPPDRSPVAITPAAPSWRMKVPLIRRVGFRGAAVAPAIDPAAGTVECPAEAAAAAEMN